MPERLFLSGRVRDDRFAISRSYSTARVSEVPRDGEDVLELVDRNGDVVQAAPMARAECCVFGLESVHELAGSVEVVDAAARVRVRTKDRILWDEPLLEQPTLSLECDVRGAGRRGLLVLDLQMSESHPGALMQVLYQWSGQSRVVDVVPPAKQYKLDLSDLPGGEACRVWVHYCNGMRSVLAATATFSLPKLAPRVLISAPSSETIIRHGQPIEMLGQVIDPQVIDNIPLQDDLEWLFDGVSAGRGFVACIMEATPGLHTIELVHRASGQSARQALNVLPLGPGDPVPAAHWDTDQHCAR